MDSASLFSKPESTMGKFNIYNTKSGADLGIYEGTTEQEALDAYANDAGYRSYADLCEEVPTGDDEIVAEEVADFLSTAASRETSRELMEAILAVAGDESRAVRVWDEPTEAEALAIWERVTKNGLVDSDEFVWGAAGSGWAKALGVEQ